MVIDNTFKFPTPIRFLGLTKDFIFPEEGMDTPNPKFVLASPSRDTHLGVFAENGRSPFHCWLEG